MIECDDGPPGEQQPDEGQPSEGRSGSEQPVAILDRGTDVRPAGRTTGRVARWAGHNPWARLTERTRRRLALVLAIAAGLAFGVISTERQRDAQALRAERDTVLLHATVDPGSTFPAPESRRIVARLLNLGPLPIGLETVRIDAPGFERSRTYEFSDRSLAAGRTTPVSLDIGQALCTADGEDDVTSVDPTVTVGVRTASGGHKEIRLTLLDTQLIAVYHSDCAGGYDQGNFMEPPGNWELINSHGRPVLRGEAVIHAGQTVLRVAGMESVGTFAVRMRGGPIEVAARSRAVVPFEVTVARCAGSLLNLTEYPTFQLRTKSQTGPSQVYFQFTEQALYALSSLYLRACPDAA
jgi:hypothetical protein